MTHGINTQEANDPTGAELLRWFQRSRRDLPWRRTQDPYAILVSEVMLQQTRVETVLSYYERFLKRFPTVQDLSAASVEEVLGLWSGLGYYRRARLLHRSAGRIVELGGGVPRSVSELKRLPGVGSYTAAAVGSIAFGQVEPAVDGNVERVVTRLFCIAGDPKRGPARKRVEAAARELLDPKRPGESNQAMMELGATICRPRNPLCSQCPLEQRCQARLHGAPDEYPEKGRSRARMTVRRQIAVVREGNKLLLFRRPDDSPLLAGLWELPWIEGDGSGAPAKSLQGRYGGRWSVGKPHGRVQHAVTHRLFEIAVREATVEAEGFVGEGLEAGWFDRGDLTELPVSSLVWKALEIVEPWAEDSAAPASGE
jgi:A/G-specific adenine glycosylase